MLSAVQHTHSLTSFLIIENIAGTLVVAAGVGAALASTLTLQRKKHFVLWTLYNNRFHYFLIKMENLPIHKYREQLLDSILKNQVTILSAPTGSGKSTQLPQFLLPLIKKRITVSQPRRVAASSLALRVSHEMGCTLGDAVGYTVRFEDKTSSKTKIRFATDGVIVRE